MARSVISRSDGGVWGVGVRESCHRNKSSRDLQQPGLFPGDGTALGVRRSRLALAGGIV